MSILRPTLLSEAVTPNALDESIPIVKLKPPLFSTVVTLAPYHISGFIVTKPLEFFLAAMLEAFTLVVKVKSQNKNGISRKNVRSIMCMYI